MYRITENSFLFCSSNNNNNNNIHLFVIILGLFFCVVEMSCLLYWEFDEYLKMKNKILLFVFLSLIIVSTKKKNSITHRRYFKCIVSFLFVDDYEELSIPPSSQLLSVFPPWLLLLLFQWDTETKRERKREEEKKQKRMMKKNRERHFQRRQNHIYTNKITREREREKEARIIIISFITFHPSCIPAWQNLLDQHVDFPCNTWTTYALVL